MKRLTTLLLLLCCLPFMAMAQDLNPGQQSQGLLESRNVTVDYSTGIFHYQIPLYTLKSGDYELPISLRYTGKGVKVSDNPGLVGYNWTLDTGGVVTRIVRGGIPDEDYNYGYLKFENDPTPLSEDATRVNRHKRDGECDIFTAVFGSKSVNFIIRKDGNGDLYAEPLERTDVKIECEGSRSFISGWTVTDNDGTRYNYMRTEWTTDLNKQDEISFNGLSNLEYVSSWHLTKIEPMNSEAITFEYSNSDKTRFYGDEYYIKYEYGRAIIEPDYNFDNYKVNFNHWIDVAKQSLIQDTQIHQIEYNLQTFEMTNLWNDSLAYLPLLYEKNKIDKKLADELVEEYIQMADKSARLEELLEKNHRALGMIGTFSPLYTSVEVLIEQLESLKEAYKTNPNISTCFSTARSILIDYLSGTNKKYIGERTTDGAYFYRTKTPFLKSIRSKESILFEYDSKKEQLVAIIKRTKNGSSISSHRLSYSNGKLVSLSFMDKDSANVETTRMEYYTLPQGTKSMADIYGYRKPYSSDPEAAFHPESNEEYSRILSLKEIQSADGGKICLDYELNGFPNATEGIPFGGIRIKSLVLDNPSEGRKDTVTYHYDLALHTYLEMPDNYVEEEYAGFTDKVWHSRIKTTGHATLSPGNNGIYYPQVRERISGQGTRTFFFNFTDYGIDWSHSHWLTGLPVYTIEQDENGGVECVQEYLYYTDVNNGLAFCLFPESLIHSEKALYNKALSQMVANEKYMDRNVLERHYAEQEGFYLDGSTFNPHMEYYQNNILPRIQYEYSNVCYPLHYGGATVLAEQREYRPKAGEYTDTWSLMEEEPCSRTVYHYDNLDKHTRPTRIVNYNANGDSTVVHQVYVGDMEASANGAIATMQTANILSPIMKRAVVKNGKLQEEEVTVYGTVDKEDGCFYAPEKVLVRKGGNGSYVPNTSSLYSGSVADYQERKEMTSAVIGGDSYLPVEITEQGTHTAYAYDPNSKWCILQATDTPADKVIAVEGWHYKQYAHPMERILSLATKLQEGIEGYDPESILLDNYQEFRATQFYERGKKLLELLAKEAEPIGLSELLDSCAVDFYIGIDDYIVWQIALEQSYFPAEGILSPWNMTYDEMYELLITLMTELQENNGTNLLNYLQTYREREDFMPQTLAMLAGQADYTLHLVPMEANAVVTYTITHNGGTTERTLELSGLTPGKVKEVSLDLNAYSGASGITITGFGNVQYLAVVPEGTEFEATSYNEDSTVSLKFDPSGHMELYEYDQAGRLIRVRDENGKILKGNEYNKKHTNL